MGLQRSKLLLALLTVTCCCVTSGKQKAEVHQSALHDEVDERQKELPATRRRRPPPVSEDRWGEWKGRHVGTDPVIKDARRPVKETWASKEYQESGYGFDTAASDEKSEVQKGHGSMNSNGTYQASSSKRESPAVPHDDDVGRRRFGLIDDVPDMDSHGTYPPGKEQKADPAMCLGRKSGIHEGGPCEQWYLSCRKGKAKKVFCGGGLYWNGDEGRCEAKESIYYCRLRFDCSGLDDGVYVDGCSNVFWFCAGETASLSKCPKGLYFNLKKLRCDFKKRIPACGSAEKIEDSRKKKSRKRKVTKDKGFKKPTRKAKWQIAYTVMEPYEKQHICEERKDGEHAIGRCHRKYLLCLGGKGLIVKCPGGQLFSQKHGRCINAIELSYCSEVQKISETTTIAGYQPRREYFLPTVQMPSSYPVSCTSLSNGIYQLGDCEKDFLICVNGVGRNASCSTGLAFNGLTGQCDYQRNIEKCPQYGKTGQELASVTQDEDKDCRCKGQEDGLYAVGCTEKFYSCSNGISTGFECPPDMVFNVDGGFCDDPKNVAVCGGQPSINSANLKEKYEEYNLPSGCAVLDDGIYGLAPCGPGYYHCWRGATSFGKCTFGLVFNPSLGRCDFKENVHSCAEFNETSKSVGEIRELTATEGDLSKCNGLSDGFYSEGCSQHYFGCANGEVFYMSCPPNLVFDSRSGTCEEGEYVPECSNSEDEEEKLPLSQGSTAQPLLSCSELPNGPHQLGLCSVDYFICRDGTTRLTSCPEPLVFNPDSSQCDFRINVIACRKKAEATENEADPQCTDSPDGIFCDGCSRNFHICAKGVTYRFACPDEKVYNSEFGRCEDPSGVRACLQPAPMPAISQNQLLVNDVRSDLSTPLLRSPGGTTVKIMDMRRGGDGDCDGQPDGNYATNPCSGTFYACVNELKVPMSCPETLVFDASTKRCEERKKNPRCSTGKTVLDDVSSQGRDVTGLFESSTTPYLNTPVCAGRKDGAYAFDWCLQSYFRCYNQKTSVEHCPDTMVFDGGIGACTPEATCARAASANLRTSVPISLSSSSFASSSPASATLAPASTLAPQVTGVGSVETDLEDLKLTAPYCRELPDGDYSAGCVSNFITCTGGVEVRNNCPDSTVFSNVLRRCVPYEECVFLMYRILASSHPVHTVGEVKKLYNITAWNGYSNISDPMSATTTFYTQQPQPLYRSGLSCFNLPDGDYSHGCSNAYTTCVNGITVVRNCRDNQIYDASAKRCSSLTRCADEPLSSTPPTIVRHRISLNMTGILDCNALSDGLYALGSCMNKFVQCSGKISYVLDCPPDLIFNSKAGRCEYATAKCTERVPSSLSSEEYSEEEQDENHFCIPKHYHNRADAIRCDRLEDGIYAMQCSNKMIICDRGRKKIRRCPEGRVFVPKLRKCTLPSECRRTHRCRPGFISVTYVAKFEAEEALEGPYTSDDFSCADLPDGLYGEQCSPSYIKCLHGEVLSKACHKGRVFDQHSGRCVPADSCDFSSSTPASDQVPCVEGARYGVGNCNDHYYSCVNGEFVIAKCPPGDSFDAARGICGNKCDLCGCAGGKTTTPGCYPGEVTSRGRCLNTYLECNSQQTFELRRCSEGKRFDSASLVCRIYDEVDECYSAEGAEDSYAGSSSAVPPQPQFQVDDSFQPPPRLSPNLQSIFVNPAEATGIAADLKYGSVVQPGVPFAPTVSLEYGLSPRIFQVAPLTSVFVPQTAPVQKAMSAFGAVAGPPEPVKDTFHALPAPYGSVPFESSPIQDVLIDQFRPPNRPPYPLPSYPIPKDSYGPVMPANSSTTGESVEGSGEEGETAEIRKRTKRGASFELQRTPDLAQDLSREIEGWYSSSDVQELCRTKKHPVNVALGFCHQDYILCDGKNMGHVMSCADEELFDDRLESCVPALDCGRKTLTVRSIINETASVLFDCSSRKNGAYALGCSSKFAYCWGGRKHAFVCQDGLIFDGDAQQCKPPDLVKTCVTDTAMRTTSVGILLLKGSPCAHLPDGTYALFDCSQHFLSCFSSKALLRSCAKGLFYDESKQHCDNKENVKACTEHTQTSHEEGEVKMAMSDTVHEVPSLLPNLACSVDGSVSLGCSPFFIMCAGGIAYMFHCDSGLVFDQATSSCNTAKITSECAKHFNQTALPEKGPSSSTTFRSTSGDSLQSVNFADVSSDVSTFNCTNARDGIHAFQCSPLFFVCSAGQITGFVCQDALVFNLETGFCDQRGYVASCGGARLISSPSTLSISSKGSSKTSFITTQPSYHSSVHVRRECGAKFTGVVSRGCAAEFILCAHGVDHVFTCQQGLVYNIEMNRCDYYKNVAACTGQASYTEKAYGVSHYESGSISSIRIVDLRAVFPSTSVMKARCGTSLGRAAAYGHCRMDYITCMKEDTAHQSFCTSGYLFDEDVGRCVPAAVCGTVGDAVAGSMSLAKGMCDGIQDGVAMGSGTCLNHYYVCMKGVPIRRRCFKHLETFSAAAGACVSRSQNPECLDQPPMLTDAIKRVRNANDFCLDRPDGMYRHPEDCARILQCFGEEVFEHLPCTDGLVFNEVSGGCDYRSSVPECTISAGSTQGTVPAESKKSADSGCKGKSHGEFVVDEKDCSVYYRCIWGKMEMMICPENTVFNPVLSVCDYPNEVPYCKIAPEY